MARRVPFQHGDAMSNAPSTERGNALLQLVVESRLRAESDRMAVGHSPDSQARSRAMLDLGGWIDRLKAAEDAQPPEPRDELIRRMTAAMREADETFERVGGSTRHHIRDCLLPILAKHGLSLHACSPKTKTGSQS